MLKKVCILLIYSFFFRSSFRATVLTAADLYIVLLDTIRSKPDSAGHGSEGYYFAVNGQYSAIEVARTISEALVDLGAGESREPAAFTTEETDKFFGVCRFSQILSHPGANSWILLYLSFRKLGCSTRQTATQGQTAPAP